MIIKKRPTIWDISSRGIENRFGAPFYPFSSDGFHYSKIERVGENFESLFPSEKLTFLLSAFTGKHIFFEGEISSLHYWIKGQTISISNIEKGLMKILQFRKQQQDVCFLANEKAPA